MTVSLTHTERHIFENLAIILSVLSVCLLCDGSECEGYFKGCCPDSFWNSKTQQCEPCMPGFSGVNCLSFCPYPYYGEKCQTTCKCSKDLCDIFTGCISLTTENEATIKEHSSPHVNKKHNNFPTENSTLLYEKDNAVSTDKNQTYIKKGQSNTENDKIILCIHVQILGCVDIILICTYSAVYIYERQHRTPDFSDTNEIVPGNSLTYENAEIVFFSATGNQLFCNVEYCYEFGVHVLTNVFQCQWRHLDNTPSTVYESSTFTFRIHRCTRNII